MSEHFEHTEKEKKLLRTIDQQRKEIRDLKRGTTMSVYLAPDKVHEYEVSHGKNVVTATWQISVWLKVTANNHSTLVEVQDLTRDNCNFDIGGKNIDHLCQALKSAKTWLEEQR